MNFDQNEQTRGQRILDRFLVNNPELEELSARLSVFNIFKVLRIEDAEIRHSNVLAWLLDPNGSHGLADAFLRRFLSTLLLENQDVNNITAAQMELMDLSDVEVWREWNNIDVLAISQRNNWALLIENKINAKPSLGQSSKYANIVREEWPKLEIIPVLLTLDEDDGIDVAEKSGYIACTHAQAYEVAERIINQRQDRIPHDAKIFLDHYLDILRRITMKDPHLVLLCKEIYRKHKDAIDLIIQWGATSQFQSVAEEFMSQAEGLTQLNVGPRRLWFIPREWEVMPAISNGWRHLSKPYPIACWFAFAPQRSKLGLIIEIGPLKDPHMRQELVEAFHKEQFKVGSWTSKTSKYTRVYSVYRIVRDIDDRDEIRKHMDELLAVSQNAISSAGRVIGHFDWSPSIGKQQS